MNVLLISTSINIQMLQLVKFIAKSFKERKGEYFEATVQVIPHITDALKDKIKRVAHYRC